MEIGRSLEHKLYRIIVAFYLNDYVFDDEFASRIFEQTQKTVKKLDEHYKLNKSSNNQYNFKQIRKDIVNKSLSLNEKDSLEFSRDTGRNIQPIHQGQILKYLDFGNSIEIFNAEITKDLVMLSTNLMDFDLHIKIIGQSASSYLNYHKFGLDEITRAGWFLYKKKQLLTIDNYFEYYKALWEKNSSKYDMPEKLPKQHLMWLFKLLKNKEPDMFKLNKQWQWIPTSVIR